MRASRTTILSLLLLFLAGDTVVVFAKKPPRDVLGLRIGMTEQAAHKRLRKIATQERRKRKKDGEQEIWILKNDSRFEYLLTRFNREHQLTLIMVVAHPNRIKYTDIATVNEATVATDGRNFSYRWKIDRSGDRPASLLIARGSSSEYLTSYSFYPAKE